MPYLIDISSKNPNWEKILLYSKLSTCCIAFWGHLTCTYSSSSIRGPTNLYSTTFLSDLIGREGSRDVIMRTLDFIPRMRMLNIYSRMRTLDFIPCMRTLNCLFAHAHTRFYPAHAQNFNSVSIIMYIMV